MLATVSYGFPIYLVELGRCDHGEIDHHMATKGYFVEGWGVQGVTWRGHMQRSWGLYEHLPWPPISDKYFPICVFRLLLRKVWRLEKLRVSKIRISIVQIFFSDSEWMKEIIKGGLWCFNNNLLALQMWDRSKDFSVKTFREVYFRFMWVDCWWNAIPKRWDERLLGDLEIQGRFKSGSIQQKKGDIFFHIWGKINIEKPLRRGI